MNVAKSNVVRLLRPTAGAEPPKKSFVAGRTAKVYRFKTADSDRRNFGRIECITGVTFDFDGDCVCVGLYTDGHVPVNFFHSLKITVEDLIMGIDVTAKVEEVQVEGKNVTLRSSHLHRAITSTILPSPAAYLRITTEDGDMIQNYLLPLLDAGMD